MPPAGQRYPSALPSALIRPHLESWIAREYQGNQIQASQALGLSPRRMYAVIHEDWITFDVADRLFCRMGDPAAYWLGDEKLRAAYEGGVVWEADMHQPITEESKVESIERREQAQRDRVRLYKREKKAAA